MAAFLLDDMKLLLISLLLLSSVAMAEDKIFTWTPPTQNTDGSPFNYLTDQLEARVYCLESGAFVEVMFVAPGAANTLTVDFLPGTYSCNSTAVNLAGIESVRSNNVSFTVAPPTKTPNPNTNFGVS